MFVLQERKYHGRQITLSRKVFRYLFYRKANIRVDVTEDVLALYCINFLQKRRLL
jgi:hypothetical protein